MKFLGIRDMVFLSQKVHGNMMFTVYWKVLVLIFSKMEIRSLLEPKRWRRYDIYWLLKSSCFNLFGNGKYGLFLSQKVDGNMIFTDYWKVLVLNFSVMGNAAFFWVKKLMERWYLRSLFELSMIFQDLGNKVFRAVLVRH